ncbi:wHTH domain-containing protein [Streptomyces broussonetiae]|uniref:wHTH-Hsp90 Na associated domain-containing protein n=1 Tax=Streptomyces broussonetiae TaxID=2686304 RepID=A0A6I6NFQ3_9ACTN|nr:hypothetical protein [Streptomyces broussonetiae]QHA06817.1 hypothetical protein GQF42_29145 [Streptomyces broussonetiae]
MPTATGPRRQAESSNTSITELAAVWRGLGVEVPDEVIDVALPAATGDLILLWDLEDEEAGRLGPGEIVPPGRIAEAAVEPGLRVPEVCSRLQDRGFPVSLRVPAHQDDLDGQLLDAMGPCSWWGVATGDAMPFAHIVVAARDLHRSPRELAERLASYGVPPSCPDLPDGLSFSRTLDLLLVSKTVDHYLGDSEVSLQHLVHRATGRRPSLRSSHG